MRLDGHLSSGGIVDLTSSPLPLNHGTSVDEDSFHPSPTPDVGIMRFPDDLPCNCNGPTLVSMQQTIREWAHLYNQKAERHWLPYYEEALLAAFDAPGHVVDEFYADVTHHVEEGHAILQSVEEIMLTLCQCCSTGLKYDIRLLYDVLLSLLPELKFYEIMLALHDDSSSK